MARYLKQSTAFTFRIGPFLDSTDGVTAETGLTIAQADIQISKDGGAFAQTSDASPTTTHDTDGWYQCPLTATDTNTLGPLTVQIVASGALPVWEHFMVLPANVYDSIVDGSDNLDVNSAQVGGQTASATAGVDFDDLAAILTDTAEIGAAGAGLTEAGGTGDQLTAIPWNAAWDAEVQSEVDDGLTAFFTSSAQLVDDIWDEVITGANHNVNNSAAKFLREAAEGIGVTGTAQGGAAGSITLASNESSTDDLFNFEVVQIIEGTGAGQARLITDYDGTTNVATVHRNWTTNPDNTSVYSIAGAESALAAILDQTVTATAAVDFDDLAAILTDTAEIGAAGAGLTEAGGTGDQLTAVPYNSSWDAEIQSEVNDALVALGLDHLLAASAAGTDITDDSIIAQLVSASATADWDDFDNTTDALQALRDHIGDGTSLTEAGGTGDHLTALPESPADVTSISGDSTAADRLEALMDGLIVGQVNDVSATTTAFAADGFTEATDDHFNGRLITFISGALTGQQTDITDYDASGGTQGSQEFTVTALTESPADGDFFVVH